MIDRRQIKREYKKQIRPAGIYAVVNNQDKKIFIGKTRNPDNVVKRLIFELDRATHPYKNMVNDYERIGKKYFDIKICNTLDIKKLEEDEIEEKLDELYLKQREIFDSENFQFYNKYPGH